MTNVELKDDSILSCFLEMKSSLLTVIIVLILEAKMLQEKPNVIDIICS